MIITEKAQVCAIKGHGRSEIQQIQEVSGPQIAPDKAFFATIFRKTATPDTTRPHSRKWRVLFAHLRVLVGERQQKAAPPSAIFSRKLVLKVAIQNPHTVAAIVETTGCSVFCFCLCSSEGVEIRGFSWGLRG